MKVVIREFLPNEDFMALTALIHRAYIEIGELGLNMTAVDQTPKVTKDRCSNGTCLVAEVDGKLVGTILIKANSPNEECDTYRNPDGASIHQFGVDPAMKGKGIGAKLHSAAIEVAENWGKAFVSLDTSVTAARLIRMYQGWGYEIVEEVQWPGKAYRSYIMQLQLQN